MNIRRGRTRKRNAPVSRQWPHLPSVARKWLGRSSLAAVCGVTLAAVLWYGVPSALRWASAHPYFAITKLEVDGNRRLTRHDVLEWIGVDEGMSIWQASPMRLQMRLQSHPWIQRASVQRDFPHHVAITLRERRPVAIVRLDVLNYVDRSGCVLGPLRDDDSRDFPLITGFDDEAARGFATIGIHRALQFLRRCDRSNCFGGISEVYVSAQRGITVFPQRTAVAVRLGWGAWGEKLARCTRVLAAWDRQVARIAAVDVSFREIVVLKLHAEHRPNAVRGLKQSMRV